MVLDCRLWRERCSVARYTGQSLLLNEDLMSFFSWFLEKKPTKAQRELLPLTAEQREWVFSHFSTAYSLQTYDPVTFKDEPERNVWANWGPHRIAFYNDKEKFSATLSLDYHGRGIPIAHLEYALDTESDRNLFISALESVTLRPTP